MARIFGQPFCCGRLPHAATALLPATAPVGVAFLLLMPQVEPGAVQRLQGPGGFTLLHMACADKSLYMTAHTALSLMMGGFYHQQRLWGTQGPGSAAVVKLLLDAGADPNVRTTSEASPLHIAACSNSADVVRLLVAAGATARANKAYKGAAVAAAMLRTGCWLVGSLQTLCVCDP